MGSYCTHCGSEMPIDAVFCVNCGTPKGVGRSYCGNCGSQLDPNSGFCVNCGVAPDNTAAGASMPVFVEPVPPTAGGPGIPYAGPPAQPNNGKLKKTLPIIIIAGVLAFVALMVVLVVSINASSTINLNKYLTIEAEGYDGYGSVRASIDWVAITEKYGKKVKFTKRASRELFGMDWFVSGAPILALEQGIRVRMEKSSNVSNGEEINYEWVIDEELYDYVKVKLKYNDDTYTVSGLSTVGTFDAFADVEVTFSGFAPNGRMEYRYNGSDLDSYYFSCDKTDGLSNGDTVTLKIDSSKIESLISRIGKVPAESEKQYVVSGLDEYVAKYSDLTEDLITKMRSEAEDTIYSYTASNYDSTSSLSGLTYSGYIMSMIKDAGSYYDDKNCVYIIYSGTVGNSEGKFSTAKVFFPVKFTNILKNADGMTYEENEGIVGRSDLDGSWSSTSGYTNPLLCYMEIVEANRDKYTSECGDGFEVYQNRTDIAKLEDIGENGKQALRDDAKTRIESYMANEYNEDMIVSGLTFKGEYLLVAKTQGSDFAKNNRYFVVYSATISHAKNEFPTTTVYYPVEYDGIVKLPDEYMVTKTEGIQGHATITDTWYGTDGYIDGATMFSELITANRDSYTYEVSDGLTEFGS